jgi:DNA-binding MarR family transcriptional regulator
MEKIHYILVHSRMVGLRFYAEGPMPQSSKPDELTESEMGRVANLVKPGSIFDLLNFRIAEFYGLSGSLVTRLCEGKYGITREAWQFIAMLAALGPMSPSELATKTTVDRSQASKTLKGLIAKKLIFRRAVPGDGRRATIGLTLTGHALYEQIFPKVVEVHHSVLADLSIQEKKLLASSLQKIQAGAVRATATRLVDAHADRRHGGSRASWQSPNS